MDSKEFRVLVKHCFLKGKSSDEAQAWLEKCYVNIKNVTIPQKETICNWYEEFEELGTTSTDTTAKPSNVIRRKRVTKSPESESCLCDVCGKDLPSSDALKHHRLEHESQDHQVSYQCTTCGKLFRDRSNLRVNKLLMYST